MNKYENTKDGVEQSAYYLLAMCNRLIDEYSKAKPNDAFRAKDIIKHLNDHKTSIKAEAYSKILRGFGDEQTNTST